MDPNTYSPPSLQPQPVQPTPGPKPDQKRGLRLIPWIVAGGIAGVLVLGGIAWALLSFLGKGSAPSSSNSQSSQVAENSKLSVKWTIPEGRAITHGGTPLHDPCSLLTIDEVATTTSDQVVMLSTSHQYIDEDIPAGTPPSQNFDAPQCTYTFGKVTGDDTEELSSIALTVEQSPLLILDRRVLLDDARGYTKNGIEYAVGKYSSTQYGAWAQPVSGVYLKVTTDYDLANAEKVLDMALQNFLSGPARPPMHVEYSDERFKNILQACDVFKRDDFKVLTNTDSYRAHSMQDYNFKYGVNPDNLQTHIHARCIRKTVTRAGEYASVTATGRLDTFANTTDASSAFRDLSRTPGTQILDSTLGGEIRAIAMTKKNDEVQIWAQKGRYIVALDGLALKGELSGPSGKERTSRAVEAMVKRLP